MIILVALAAGCGSKGGDTGGDEDVAYAEAMWDEIAEYRSWGQLDGWSSTAVESGSHTGAPWVVAYYDDALVSWNLSGDAPDGGTAVKEQWDTLEDSTTAEPALWTAMRKRAGYDPDNGDWFYAWYDGDGSVHSAGMVTLCQGCHAAATTDHVFGAPPG